MADAIDFEASLYFNAADAGRDAGRAIATSLSGTFNTPSASSL